MKPIITENIQLVSKQEWLYRLTEKIACDNLLYSINYKESDEGKIISAKIIGKDTSKTVHISLNTNKGVKTGEFNSPATFGNIFFLAECIQFFCDTDIDFRITIFQN